jgi:hypothetical protein
MRYSISFLILVLVFCGCKKAEPAADMQAAFKSAPEQQQQKQLADEAMTAFKNNDYPKAVVNLQTLRADPNLNGDQRTAVQDMMAQVQQQLVRRMEAGDKNAEAAYRMIQAMPKH